MNSALNYIHPEAKIGKEVTIDPFSVVHKNVEIGDGTWIGSNVTIFPGARIGKKCRIFPGAVIAAIPQDLKFEGEETTAEIGDHTTNREFVTINRGTVKGGEVTRIGDHNLIMAYTHIAHDCQVGSHIIMANAATLGGHVIVEDWASVGALCPVHHFVRIGTHSIIGGGTTVTRDVLPFSKTSAERGTHAYGLNAIGLERRGFSKDRIKKLHHAYRLLLASKLNTSQAVVKMKSEADRGEDVDQLIRFIEASERGVIK